MNQFKETQLDTISEKHSLDRIILEHDEDSSSVDRLRSHLQRLKSRFSYYLKDQILNLIFENDYLRARLTFSEKSRQILLALQRKLSEVFKTIEDALCEVTERLRETENNYLKL